MRIVTRLLPPPAWCRHHLRINPWQRRQGWPAAGAGRSITASQPGRGAGGGFLNLAVNAEVAQHFHAIRPDTLLPAVAPLRFAFSQLRR